LKIREINSVKSDILKKWKKLQTKKGREDNNRYLIEGYHLINESFWAKKEIIYIIYTRQAELSYASFLKHFSNRQKVVVTREVMHFLSDLKSPQGIAAIIESDVEIFDDWLGNWLLLDSIQDPGNVGTMVRTADAAGLTGVILGEGSAEFYNPKTLRAMQGSNFHIRLCRKSLEKMIPLLQNSGCLVYGTEVSDERATNFLEVKKTDNFAIIVGNEGQGISRNIRNIVDQNLYIPLYGQAESLNVSVAAGILIYNFITKGSNV